MVGTGRDPAQIVARSDKARQTLGWYPQVDFRGLVKMMIEHDLELARREKYALGYQTV